ncbi:ribonuclease R [Aerococcaceae bacterium WGS1372]
MSLSKLETRILELLQDNPDKQYKTDQIAQYFNYKGSKNYKKLVKALAFLERINKLQVTENGRFMAMDNSEEKVIGVFRGNDRGFGFIDYDEDLPDLFVPPNMVGNALNGDTVEVSIIKRINPSTSKGSEARVERIVERNTHQLVGEFIAYDTQTRENSSYIGFIIPQGQFNDQIKVQVLDEGIRPINHSVVILKIKDYPSVDEPKVMTGYVCKEIGHKDEPGVDILSILYQFNIPHEFPKNVLEMAQSIPQEVQVEELEGRRDLREELIITIDGADAKDLDDAISLTKLSDDRYKLGVHIADVSHYVTENSFIDREAYERGTSVYLTDRVVPMLPQRLSNGICSLLPGVDRLTVSCEMIIDSSGKVQDFDIFLSVINSSYRMTYTEVNLILDGDKELRQEYDEIVGMLEDMRDLHHQLEAMRRRRGALSFETPEAQIIVDEEGHPLKIIHRQRGVGERMIESFMLVANETVAKSYTDKEFPMIYRVHEQPDEDRMHNFAEFITAFGVILRGQAESIRPKQLQEALEQLQDTPYEEVVSMMMLRSMQQARYAEDPLGHYGLAAKDYTHFTSPIRRYPDLIVHRLIHQYLQANPTDSDKRKLAERIPDIAEHSSKMERRAVDAERETDALKKAEYMMDKIGEQFEGMISSITSFGMFVQLPNTVEGLISLPKLSDDYYQYDSQHLILIGERTHNVYRIGQQVLIEVEAVNIDEREIDFKLIESYETDNKDLEHVIEANKQKKRRKQQQKQMSKSSKKQHRQSFKKIANKRTKPRKGKFKIRRKK